MLHKLLGNPSHMTSYVRGYFYQFYMLMVQSNADTLHFLFFFNTNGEWWCIVLKVVSGLMEKLLLFQSFIPRAIIYHLWWLSSSPIRLPLNKLLKGVTSTVSVLDKSNPTIEKMPIPCILHSYTVNHHLVGSNLELRSKKSQK